MILAHVVVGKNIKNVVAKNKSWNVNLYYSKRVQPGVQKKMTVLQPSYLSVFANGSNLRVPSRVHFRSVNASKYVHFIEIDEAKDGTKYLTPLKPEQEDDMFTMPTVDNLVVLAAVLGVTIDEILAVDDRFQARISA